MSTSGQRQLDVLHASYARDPLSPIGVWNSSSQYIDLTNKINEKRIALTYGVSTLNKTVEAAISDYAQGAGAKYPVLSKDSNGEPVPMGWCTEFASWAFRTGASAAGYPGFFGPDSQGVLGDIPIAAVDGEWDEDLGVGHVWDFLEFNNLERYYGDDSVPQHDENNMPSFQEWMDLATTVKAGDFVAWKECRAVDSAANPPNCTSLRAHAMVVVGWLADDGSDVWDPGDAAGGKDINDYFDRTRPWNRLLTVSGNLGDNVPGTGLGTIVDVRAYNVCRFPVPLGGGAWGDPVFDADGDGDDDSCHIRLWDTDVGYVEWRGDPILGEAGFFGDMQYP